MNKLSDWSTYFSRPTTDQINISRPIRRIVTDPEMPPKEKRQTLMFSATFPPAIKNIAQEFLHNYLFLTIGVFGGACSDVKQAFHQVGGCLNVNIYFF